MNKLVIVFSFLILSACAAPSRVPARDKSKTYLGCTPMTKESGDVALYWKLAAGEANNTSLEDICTIPVLSLHPTQFAVGMIDVQRKVDRFKALDLQEQDKYMRKNPEPIVIGPHGEFFIIDHHHLATALNQSGVKSTYGIILENWNNTQDDAFWIHMKDKNWVYAVDQNGNKKSIDDLMKIITVKDLKDDPYRTLAGQTRCKVEEKCSDEQWLKQPIPFIEFLWAEHFRKTPSVSIALKNFGNSDFDKVTAAASLEVKRLKGKLPNKEVQ